MTVIIAILGSGAFSALVAWLVNRKMHKAQTTETKAKTEKLYSEIYSKLLADQRSEINNWKEKHEALDREFRQKIQELSIAMEELERLNRAYKAELSKLRKENKELKENKK